MMKPFFLYVHERLGIVVGVLIQLLGSWNCPVAYWSKQFDTVSWGWPPCLRALVATVVLLPEADKLTLWQELTVWVPHSVLTLMGYKGNYWLTNSWMVRYQSMLYKNVHIWLEVVKTLNPATLLQIVSDSSEHDCLEVMDVASGHWVFHRWQQLSLGWHTFSQICSCDSGHCHWSKSVLVGTSAQKADLIALIWALQLTAGVWTSIWMDFKCVFTTIHVYGSLYKEKGINNLWGKKC
jgi:hypothetical protein